MKKLMLGFAAITLLAACGTKSVAETVEEAPLEFPNETIAAGYALYSSDCSKCHRAKTVENFSREQWDEILPKMARKAKISDEQELQINEYINWELAN